MDPCGSGAKKYTDDEDGDSGLTATQIGILTFDSLSNVTTIIMISII